MSRELARLLKAEMIDYSDLLNMPDGAEKTLAMVKHKDQMNALNNVPLKELNDVFTNESVIRIVEAFGGDIVAAQKAHRAFTERNSAATDCVDLCQIGREESK